MDKKKIKGIIEDIIKSYIDNDESTAIVSGNKELAEAIAFEFKKKGVKVSYIIDEEEILMEIDPVWDKWFPHDSAADKMLKFREWMQYRMHFRCLTEILRFNICSEHIEKVDVLKRTFWYEKISKKA